MNSTIRLISDEIDTYLPNSDNTALIKRRNYILPSPRGKFFIVAFISHKRDGANISPVIHKAIKHDIGVLYVCDKLPSSPIIHPNVHYIEVPDIWFIHTLFMNPLMFSASYASRSKRQLSKAFHGFTKYQIPIISTSSDVPKIVENYEKNKNNILVDITGGVGDHLLTIPSLKTLAVKHDVYVLCEKHREPCFYNLSYIKGFYNKRQDVDISKFRKVIHLHFGQLLNDYRLDLNKQNRIYSVAEVCGLSKEELVINRPEIILTDMERKTASIKYDSYRNKVFLGYDSARVDSKIPSDLTQRLIDDLKRKSCSVFTSSVRRRKFQNCTDLSRDLSLRELFALISVMDCVYTIDTSFLHIAAAFDKQIFCMLNYFKPAWRCGTYVNCKTYTPNVSCFPCVAFQFVEHEDRKCHTKSCYSFQDTDLILKDIKEYLKNKSKIKENIQTVDTSYVPDTKKDISLMDLPGKIVSSRENDKLRIGAFWMGGVGDTVMLGYLCRAIHRKYPNSYIDAYVRDKTQAQLLVFDYPNIRGISSNLGWGATVGKHKHDYDIIYEFRHYPYVWNKSNPKLNRPFDKSKYDNWQLASEDIINNWKSEVFRYYAKQTGLSLNKSDLIIPLAKINEDISYGYLKKYKLPKKYITIHAGCDQGVGIMKLWSRKKWQELIVLLQERDIEVIQIGTPSEISFANIQKVGVDNLTDLAYILKLSKLHVDNEGGVVHLAHAVETKSVVLFGATSPTLYGYPDNINLYKDVCPTCWWKVNQWSSKCMKGNKSCINLDELTVEEVLNAIEKNYE